jgi:hypothetical protein
MQESVESVLTWKEGGFTFYASREPEKEVSGEEAELVLSVGIVVQNVLRSASAMSGADRRVHARAPVSMKVVRRDGGRASVYYTRDVSAGGLFVLSNDPPNSGQKVSLELWVPTLLEPVLVECTVIRAVRGEDETSLGGFAVEFGTIDSHARTVLERLGGAMDNLL